MSELQRNLKRALLRVERGEALPITRRRRTAAKIVPAPHMPAAAGKFAPWPDLAARSAAIMGGKQLQGSPASDIVIEGRG